MKTPTIAPTVGEVISAYTGKSAYFRIYDGNKTCVGSGVASQSNGSSNSIEIRFDRHVETDISHRTDDGGKEKFDMVPVRGTYKKGLTERFYFDSVIKADEHELWLDSKETIIKCYLPPYILGAFIENILSRCE
jgi:hypothetical protein